MEIDIVSYTDEQLASLEMKQMVMVRKAQIQKNRLKAKHTQSLRKYKSKLIKNGMYNSDLFNLFETEESVAYFNEVEAIREKLIYDLQASGALFGGGTTGPYEVNYNLPVEERMLLVKTYYETTYSNPAERLVAFEEDEIAPEYLAELYAPLHDYFIAAAG